MIHIKTVPVAIYIRTMDLTPYPTIIQTDTPQGALTDLINAINSDMIDTENNYLIQTEIEG